MNNKYAKGKIYKLVSNHTNNIYFGSTTDSLPKRKSKHKYNYGQYLNNNYGYTTSFELFKLGDVDIILVEAFPCANKYELFARERFYIENNECLNKCNPCTRVKSIINCDCGVQYNSKSKWRHENSKHHLEFLLKNQ